MIRFVAAWKQSVIVICPVTGFDWNLVFKWNFMSTEEVFRRNHNIIAPIRFVVLVLFFVVGSSVVCRLESMLKSDHAPKTRLPDLRKPADHHCP